ncbi:MAG: hypothetical protein IPL47_14130 [Phyllobacteriaceae bacterium]|nr:hypothetical protein [Phyllobacteriaceae bacterium]
MKKAAAAIAMCLASAGPAAATGDIYCHNDEADVGVSLLVSRSEALTILRSIVTIGEESWSSDPGVQEGQPIAVGQGFENDGRLLVDYVAEPAGAIIARLRAFSANEGDSTRRAACSR